MPKVDPLLNIIIENNASDLHLSSLQLPYMRSKGEMEQIPFERLTNDYILNIIQEIIPSFYLKQLEETKDADFAYSLEKKHRFRVNVFYDNKGIGAVFRHIPEKIPSFEMIQLEDCAKKLCEQNKGLILVTGPTGSGKSTTLATMINLIAKNRAYHILTIEDPIEFVYKSNRSLIHQRELNIHTKSYHNALRTALRQDPDVILVGEMRDLETTKLAIEASETGHLVFATLHTNTAYSTISRIINQFNENEQELIRVMLADNLKGVICQTLLRTCDSSNCSRIAAREIWLHSVAGANMIRENKLHMIPSLLDGNNEIGMKTLNTSLIDLLKRGIISPDTAWQNTTEQKDLESRFEKNGFKLEEL